MLSVLVGNRRITDLDYADDVVLFVQQASQYAEAPKAMEQESCTSHEPKQKYKTSVRVLMQLMSVLTARMSRV